MTLAIGWGVPRIVGELRKLGIHVAKSTVEKYRVKHPKLPSPTWKSFLTNHITELVSIDFFVVPTIDFKVLYVLAVLAHERREVFYFNVTEHPTSQWVAQQMVEAFPWDTAPHYVLRDRDAIHGERFHRRVHSLLIEEVITAPRTSWQNPYVERSIGSIRRDCLDHMIVFNVHHLKRILQRYFEYYHRWRTHLGLVIDTPQGRVVQMPDKGDIIEIADLRGLHHQSSAPFEQPGNRGAKRRCLPGPFELDGRRLYQAL